MCAWPTITPTRLVPRTSPINTDHNRGVYLEWLPLFCGYNHVIFVTHLYAFHCHTLLLAHTKPILRDFFECDAVCHPSVALCGKVGGGGWSE
jgi:hypothetical protein